MRTSDAKLEAFGEYRIPTLQYAFSRAQAVGDRVWVAGYVAGNTKIDDGKHLHVIQPLELVKSYGKWAIKSHKFSHWRAMECPGEKLASWTRCQGQPSLLLRGKNDQSTNFIQVVRLTSEMGVERRQELECYGDLFSCSEEKLAVCMSKEKYLGISTVDWALKVTGAIRGKTLKVEGVVTQICLTPTTVLVATQVSPANCELYQFDHEGARVRQLDFGRHGLQRWLLGKITCIRNVSVTHLMGKDFVFFELAPNINFQEVYFSETLYLWEPGSDMVKKLGVFAGHIQPHLRDAQLLEGGCEPGVAIKEGKDTLCTSVLTIGSGGQCALQ